MTLYASYCNTLKVFHMTVLHINVVRNKYVWCLDNGIIRGEHEQAPHSIVRRKFVHVSICSGWLIEHVCKNNAGFLLCHACSNDHMNGRKTSGRKANEESWMSDTLQRAIYWERAWLRRELGVNDSGCHSSCVSVDSSLLLTCKVILTNQLLDTGVLRKNRVNRTTEPEACPCWYRLHCAYLRVSCTHKLAHARPHNEVHAQRNLNYPACQNSPLCILKRQLTEPKTYPHPSLQLYARIHHKRRVMATFSMLKCQIYQAIVLTGMTTNRPQLLFYSKLGLVLSRPLGTQCALCRSFENASPWPEGSLLCAHALFWPILSLIKAKLCGLPLHPHNRTMRS